MSGQNEWPGGIRHAMHQDEHERWNATHYPGTRQMCVACDEPTDRCEEDSIFLEDGSGPLCVDCWSVRRLLEADRRISQGLRHMKTAHRYQLWMRLIFHYPGLNPTQGRANFAWRILDTQGTDYDAGVTEAEQHGYLLAGSSDDRDIEQMMKNHTAGPL